MNKEQADFWGDAMKSEASNKEHFRKKVFDDFDEFFDFKQEQREEGVTRDDTRGADYKARVTIDFIQAVKGASVPVEMNKRVICD